MAPLVSEDRRAGHLPPLLVAQGTKPRQEENAQNPHPWHPEQLIQSLTPAVPGSGSCKATLATQCLTRGPGLLGDRSQNGLSGEGQVGTPGPLENKAAGTSQQAELRVLPLLLRVRAPAWRSALAARPGAQDGIWRAELTRLPVPSPSRRARSALPRPGPCEQDTVPAAQGREPDARGQLGRNLPAETTQTACRARLCRPAGKVTALLSGKEPRPGSKTPTQPPATVCRTSTATSVSTRKMETPRPTSHGPEVTRRRARRTWPHAGAVKGSVLPGVPLSAAPASGHILSLRVCACFLRTRLEGSRGVALSGRWLHCFPVPCRIDRFHFQAWMPPLLAALLYYAGKR